MAELSEMVEEERLCDVCGKPVCQGMTDDGGSFYAHEGCFGEYMDKIYGSGKWRETEDDGENGYYEALWSDGEWYGTGIYYTEWED